MSRSPQRILSALSSACALACFLAFASAGAAANADAAATNAGTAPLTFDLVCTTTADRVEGTLADGSPVVPSAIGEVRRYSFDLAGKRYASNGRINAIHAIDGDKITKADPKEIRSFASVVHMQSDWHLDLATGVSVRKNRFYSDGTGTTVTGGSEWHQSCERAEYSGMPAS